jgi:chemotaxis response regulator CheB
MRVLIADDQEFIRRGVRAALSEEKDIEVCAEAIDGRDALAKSLEFGPDVLIMVITQTCRRYGLRDSARRC